MVSKKEQRPCPHGAHNLMTNHKINQIEAQINAVLQILNSLWVRGTSCYERRRVDFRLEV